MIKFMVKCDNVRFYGVYASSCDAVIDAFERFPAARAVFVKALTS